MNPLCGIVLCGGSSSRMGKDKGSLQYHGKAQALYMYEMLECFYMPVYLSARTKQKYLDMTDYQVIYDKPEFADCGPIAALLTAFITFPNASFIVIACDYPFLNTTDISKLIGMCERGTDVICYKNPENGFKEPLIAVYENTCRQKLFEFFEAGQQSLRAFIDVTNHKALLPENALHIKSIDTVNEYEAAQKLIVSSKHA